MTGIAAERYNKSLGGMDIGIAHLRTPVILPQALVAEIDALLGERKRSAFLSEVAAKRFAGTACGQPRAGTLPGGTLPIIPILRRPEALRLG